MDQQSIYMHTLRNEIQHNDGFIHYTGKMNCIRAQLIKSKVRSHFRSATDNAYRYVTLSIEYVTLLKKRSTCSTKEIPLQNYWKIMNYYLVSHGQLTVYKLSQTTHIQIKNKCNTMMW